MFTLEELKGERDLIDRIDWEMTARIEGHTLR